ncbi:MAG: RelA/SpoT family protein [Candidatus Sumerlaeia bacterium]
MAAAKKGAISLKLDESREEVIAPWVNDPSCLQAMDLDEVLATDISRFSKKDRENLAKAYMLANNSHEGVKRLSGAPFIEHPLAVARQLIEMGLDASTVCAGLLHDTIEDTTVTYEQLKEYFPDPVADLVSGVTKISSLSFRSSHEEQVENLRKMVLAMARDIRVILIKLADRLHNMQTLQHLPIAKQRKIARSTMEIYAPLAHRLGIYRIKSALEDLGMHFLYPEAYKDLTQRIQNKKTDRDRHIQESIDFLQEHLEDKGIKATVTGRSKHFWSIYQKMRNQNLSFEEIYDLNALRVICNTRTECYEILGIIHSLWKPVPEHFSDYIALPKANMYQSIHTKVIGLNAQLTEIQVRTWDMHRVAEEGIAAHYRYKEGRKNENDFEKRLGWLRQMVDWLTDTSDSSELLFDLKQDVFDDKVFCFTPRGDVIELNKGATVLDFAYRIHTDLGHRCMGGKINHRFVPLRTKLKMGDLVEVEASKTPHPSADWLKIVTTSRARTKIRHWLKQRDFDRNVVLGRDMIIKALSKTGMNIAIQELPDLLEEHLEGFHVKSLEELFSETGFGSISASSVVARLMPTPEKPSRRKVPRRQRKKVDKSMVLVDGLPGSLTRFGQCCKPQPGEPITGFVTRGRGISIHHSQCPQLQHRLSQSPDMIHRVVSVSWAAEGVKHKQLGLRVICRDRKGILRDVTAKITQRDIMIVAANTRSDLGSNEATLRFTLLVESDEKMNQLVNQIRELPDVLKAVRDTKSR